MSLNRIQNLIGAARYKNSVNKDTNVGLELEQKTKPLIEYNIIDILNLSDVYLEEREKSKKYRINGKINIFTTNSLSTGSTIFRSSTGFDDYAWNPLFQGETPNNWVMQILYPSDSISNFSIKYYTGATATPAQNSKAFRGVQYKNLDATIINNGRYLVVRGVQKHNLNVDDYVYLYSPTNGSYRGIFKVLTLGFNGDNLQTDFVLDVNLDTLVPSGYYSVIPTGGGNFLKINNPSLDDLTFTNASTFFDATTSDISGNTLNIPYNNDEERYLIIKTNQPHNLLVNNYVDIRTNVGNEITGIWRVYNILDGSGSTRFVIKADIGIPNKGVTIQPAPTRDYRILDGIPSEYYVRKFEVLTTNDYEVYPCAYSLGPYPNTLDVKIGLANKSWLFQFNEDIDTTRLKTNRNGPITELYYSIVKRSGKNPYDWTNVVSNWDFNIKRTNLTNNIELISVNNLTDSGSLEKSRARKETINSFGLIEPIPGDKYVVDFVEFNPVTITETTISTINHVFRPQGNLGGYYYNPYKKLILREYSSIINTISANENYDEIPENYVTQPNGDKSWKELQPIGYSETGQNTVNYPFLNNVNYYYFDFNLYIRRQIVPTSNIINNSNLRFINQTDVNSKC